MTKDNISKGLFDLAKTYIESDRKKYEVKTTVVFDEKDPLNVSKMYLVVMFRDPRAFKRNENGKLLKDENGRLVRDYTLQFAYKTKKNCLELRSYTEYRMIKWYKPRVPEHVSKIYWKKDTGEYQRLCKFAAKYKVCTTIMESVSDCFKPATARYFKTKKQMQSSNAIAK